MKNKTIKALYIHIPFCEHICDYCDFPKLQYFRNFAIDYLKSLKEELAFRNINNGIETIYVGGGTPTALEDDLFLELLKIIKPYSENILEYTFEANPESLSVNKLKMMKEYGVNRLSIGVQTTNDKILASVNRKHTYQDVQIAISNARKIGFDNINVDLIIGLPHASKAIFEQDLTNVINLGTNHISCYSLTVHPNTVFFNKGVQEPLDEFARELYDLVESLLKKNGFIHYEISNWAKPGKESKHNFIYWKDEQYYGAGLGAAGYINDVRYLNTRNITKYNQGKWQDEEEIVSTKDDELYFVMLNLRTNRGVVIEEYTERFGKDFYKENKTKIDEFIIDGYLALGDDGKRIYPTYNGMMVLDQLILELVNE